jgi:polysaccharide export outer membrane protein
MCRLAWRLSAALLLFACAPSLPVAPLLPEQDADFKPEVVPEPPGMNEAEAAPFRLMPGDSMDLRTVSKTPLDAANLLVDEAGGVHVPLVGRVLVKGLSLREAELAIEKGLSQYDRFAKVALQLRDPGGHQAAVIGAVVRPGRLPVQPGLRLVDLLAASGGPKTAAVEGEEYDLADLEGSRLIRNREPLPLSLPRAIQGDKRHNVAIRPGDVLFVAPARARRVSVFGRVKAAKTMPFRSGMRLTEALASAGGVAKGADRADIRIIRGPLSKPKVYLANIKALIDGKGRDVVLAAGDIIYVTTHPFSSFTEVLAELTPLIATAGVAVIALPR